ncbi:MAG: aquaporin [Bdellovibrionota bacterium]
MIRKLLAEFIGTFALVFAGTGAIVANDFSNGAVSHLGIALTFGLVVMIFVYALADISGAHFNPAVSFGFLQLKKLKIKGFILYVVSQLKSGTGRLSEKHKLTY